jgi:hypothetical protein
MVLVAFTPIVLITTATAAGTKGVSKNIDAALPTSSTWQNSIAILQILNGVRMI